MTYWYFMSYIKLLKTSFHEFWRFFSVFISFPQKKIIGIFKKQPKQSTN